MRITLIVPYFGTWPVWFSAYLASCARNAGVDWLFVTDCPFPEQAPSNTRFVRMELRELSQIVNDRVGVKVPLSPRKLCDIKPAYGDVFSEYLKDADFWGFCDLDIIWGDIRGFITDELLAQYDVISSRKNRISGHFTILRNSESVRLLYRDVPNYKDCFQQDQQSWFDETVLSDYLLARSTSNGGVPAVYWDKVLLNQERGRDSHQEYCLDKWLWQGGKLYRLERGAVAEEIMYLHFINWKRTLAKSQHIDNTTARFYISYNSIHIEPHSRYQHLLNAASNLVNGYYAQETRRLRRKRLRKLKGRVIQRMQKVVGQSSHRN